jgi:hypothetical protein
MFLGAAFTKMCPLRLVPGKPFHPSITNLLGPISKLVSVENRTSQVRNIDEPVGDGEHDRLDLLGFLLSADGALYIAVVAVVTFLKYRVTVAVTDERRKLEEKECF